MKNSEKLSQKQDIDVVVKDCTIRITVQIQMLKYLFIQFIQVVHTAAIKASFILEFSVNFPHFGATMLY